TAGGYLEEDDVARAVLYAIDNGARVINMSFGDVVISRFMTDVIYYAYARGVVVIASAGNSGTDLIHYPSGLPETISVAATDVADHKAGFSNWGQTIDLSAPGQDILCPRAGGGYDLVSGTSFSAPMVTAAAAVLLYNNPELSPEQVRNLLKTSSDDLGTKGWDMNTGAGRLNLYNVALSGKTSSLIIHQPQSGTHVLSDTIAVVVTAQDPDLMSVELAYGIGKDPAHWENIITNHSYQVIRDTLAWFDTMAFPDTTLILNLRVTLWSGEQNEYRSVLTVDNTAPRIRSLVVTPLLDGSQYVHLIEIETDDITQAEIFCRKVGSTDPFIPIYLGYETTSHAYLFDRQEPTEFYVRVKNLAGLVSLDTNRGNNYVIPHRDVNFNLAEFEPLAVTLPPGYLLSEMTDFDGDQNYELVFSEYDSKNGFGPVVIYEYENGNFIRRMETSFRAIPRDWGDADNDGRLEILLGFGQKSFLLEAPEPGSWPSQLIWADSTSFWASRIGDLDQDGKNEIIGKQEQQFISLERTGNDRFEAQFVFANNSPGLNQLGPPRCEITDLDNDGLKELIFGDYDGDLVIHEITANGQAESRGYVSLAQKDATNYFFSYGAADTSKSFLLAGSIRGDDADTESGFVTRYWNFEVVYSPSNDVFEAGQAERFYGYAAVRDFDSGGNSGPLRSGEGDYVFLTLYPDLYVFKVSDSDTLIPVWYGPPVRSNTVVIGDINGDGQSEIYFNDGEAIRGYALGQVTRPPAPLSFEANPLDTTRIHLSWEMNGFAQTFYIYRGLDYGEMHLYDSTATRTYRDSLLESGQRYSYSVRAFDPSFDQPLSLATPVISAIPNPPPRFDSLVVISNRQLRIFFNEVMRTSSLQAANFVLDAGENPTTSVIPFSNGAGVLVSFANAFTKAKPAQLAIGQISDTLRTPLAAADKMQTFTYYEQTQEIPYVNAWRFIDSRHLELIFNMPMDITTLMDPANYQVTPSGAVTDVLIAEGIQNKCILTLSADTYGPSAGVTSYLIMHHIRNEAGEEMVEGDKIALVTEVSNMTALMVYPQPATSFDAWLTFAGIPAGTKISIFDVNGHLVTELEEIDQNGGIQWDMRDKNGARLASGIYIYLATFENEKKLGKFSVLK
ncbi:MAG: hypothetical protein E4H13_08810, partial [Calditrichales bacterium]